MKMPLTLAATVALAGAIGLGPAAAVTNPGPVRPAGGMTFATALAPQYYGAGEYDGVLHLTFAPDGAVNGWYRDADSGAIRTVVGGLNGDKIWLDLGTSSLVDIQGTLDDGKIVASTYLGNQPYTFTGTPTKN